MATQRARRALIMTVQWTLTIAVVGGMAFVLASRGAQLSRTPDVLGRNDRMIGVGTFALFIFNALVLQTLARPFDLHLPFVEAFTIALVDATLNYLPLKAGTVATGTILWSRHGSLPPRSPP